MAKCIITITNQEDNNNNNNNKYSAKKTGFLNFELKLKLNSRVFKISISFHFTP